MFLLSTLFQSFKPSSPFLPVFLVEHQGVTKQALANLFYPVRTYSTFVMLVPMTFFAEFVTGYKPALLLGIASRVVEQFMLYYCSGIGLLCLSQALRGVAASTKTIHGALMYLIIPHHMFPLATGFLRAANLAGQVLEGVMSNLIIQTMGGRSAYRVVFTTTQASVTFGAALMMIVFVALSLNRDSASSRDSDRPLAPKITSFRMARSLIRTVYSSPVVLLWSFWWWTAYAVSELVDDMHMALFQRISGTEHNGFISAAIGVVSFLGALIAGSSSRIRLHSLRIVLLGLLLSGSFLVAAAFCRNVLVSYALIIGTFFVLEASAVAANSIISLHIAKELRGLALFLNMFISLLVQCAIQFACQMLDFRINHKFAVLGVIMFVVGIVIYVASFRLMIAATDVAESTVGSTLTTSRSDPGDLSTVIELPPPATTTTHNTE
ncbi:hypothetical protein PBRA_009123 [Plasmodiophora brassicae]|uniref:Major facilitator superfamily (MFS) profile domain-containing protein n=1 Tax=Plasmodiophora brassicae TaxID=37360 RepID=A0A0G4J567_PLABS|nr:hypothetical protein PBRA_009123 [Plasmodiophora brassicae]